MDLLKEFSGLSTLDPERTGVIDTDRMRRDREEIKQFAGDVAPVPLPRRPAPARHLAGTLALVGTTAAAIVVGSVIVSQHGATPPSGSPAPSSTADWSMGDPDRSPSVPPTPASTPSVESTVDSPTFTRQAQRVSGTELATGNAVCRREFARDPGTWGGSKALTQMATLVAARNGNIISVIYSDGSTVLNDCTLKEAADGTLTFHTGGSDKLFGARNARLSGGPVGQHLVDSRQMGTQVLELAVGVVDSNVTGVVAHIARGSGVPAAFSSTAVVGAGAFIAMWPYTQTDAGMPDATWSATTTDNPSPRPLESLPQGDGS